MNYILEEKSYDFQAVSHLTDYSTARKRYEREKQYNFYTCLLDEETGEILCEYTVERDGAGVTATEYIAKTTLELE